jgi:hypothetical protein
MGDPANFPRESVNSLDTNQDMSCEPRQHEEQLINLHRAAWLDWFQLPREAAMRRLFAALVMPLVLDTTARAQETKPAAPQDALRSSNRNWDPIPFAPDQNEVTIADLNLVPRQLLGALRQGECDYEEHIKQVPLRFVRAGNRRFAILFCQYGAAGSHRVYDFRHEWARVPTLVQFPFLAHGRGFGATASPGFVTWDAQAATLTAILGSDMCPSPVLRHTYALGHAGPLPGASPFVLQRVEINLDGCGTDRTGPWKKLWEASDWSASVQPR